LAWGWHGEPVRLWAVWGFGIDLSLAEMGNFNGQLMFSRRSCGAFFFPSGQFTGMCPPEITTVDCFLWFERMVRGLKKVSRWQVKRLVLTMASAGVEAK